ncbi:MAG TPA: hypothetical protein VJS43_14760 [Candidatus Acidoferrales bacterium]|nr:hypothetical protein [Candidatus Acidoferrales bacterium]
MGCTDIAIIQQSALPAESQVVSLAKELRDEQCSLRQISALLAEQGCRRQALRCERSAGDACALRPRAPALEKSRVRLATRRV